MKNERISKEEAAIAMELGVLDALTVIDPGLINRKGIRLGQIGNKTTM